MRKFIVSDLHLFHQNIIKYANRTNYEFSANDALNMIGNSEHSGGGLEQDHIGTLHLSILMHNFFDGLVL